MMKTKYCIKCGRQIHADYGFRKYCGAKQPLQTNRQSTPQSAKATSQESNNYVPKSLSNPNQTLHIAKSQASFAQTRADNTMERQSLSNSADLDSANRKASMAEVEASQMEERVQRVASVSEAQSREANALSKASSASARVRKEQRALNKKHIAFEKKQNKANNQDYKQQHKLNKAEQRNDPEYQKKRAKKLLIWAWLLPIIGFLVGAFVTESMSNQVSSITFAIIESVASIIGIILGFIARKYYKKASTIAFVWLVVWIILSLFSLD